MAATIHIPDAYLVTRLTALQTNALKCILIDITSYNRATDSVYSNLTEITGTGYTAGGQALSSCVVSADTTNHWTTVVFTPATWTGSTTISATGSAIIDTTDGNKIVAVDDFGATVSSSNGTFSVNPITLKFTHF